MHHGLVQVERDDFTIDLPDESVIGRARSATLRIDHEKMHRFHAAILAEGPNMVLRSLSPGSLRVKIDGTIRDSSYHIITIGQVWELVAGVEYLVVGVRPSDQAEATVGALVYWLEIPNGIAVRTGPAQVRLMGKPAQLLRHILGKELKRASEDELIEAIWPGDIVLRSQDRRAYTSNLQVCLHALRQRLRPCGLEDRLVFRDRVLLLHFTPDRDRYVVR